jgi:hypothetical protein
MKTKMWKMMIATIVILPMALVSCQDEWMPGISGQGEIVEQAISPDDFNGFVSALSADIYLTQGETREVIVKAQQNIIDNIETDRVEGGIWTIRYHEPVRFAKPVKIFITIPTLSVAAISGSGEITGLTRFTGLDQLKLFISGSGGITLDADSKSAELAISGSGDMTMAGGTDKVNLIISGSGSFRGSDLVTPRAEMIISGSGSTRITVEEFLQVLVSGSGNVYYTGNPELDVHVSGSGSVVRNR